MIVNTMYVQAYIELAILELNPTDALNIRFPVPWIYVKELKHSPWKTKLLVGIPQFIMEVSFGEILQGNKNNSL